MTYWVAVASRDHVMRAVEGGFCQVNHGKGAPLKRMDKNDRILYYSPREEMRQDDPVQAFTAIGRIDDEEPYQAAQKKDFRPYRRQVHYFKSHDAPIKPMLEDLSFTRGKQSWGIVLRRGLFEIDEEDYRMIALAMGVPHPESS